MDLHIIREAWTLIGDEQRVQAGKIDEAAGDKFVGRTARQGHLRQGHIPPPYA